MKHVRPVSQPRAAATGTVALFLSFFTNILDAVAKFFMSKESQTSA